MTQAYFDARPAMALREGSAALPESDDGAPPRIQPQRIVVLAPRDRTRAWAARLAEALGRKFEIPTELATVPVTAAQPIPSESFEQRLFGASELGHSAWMATGAAIRAAEEGPASERLFVNATGHSPHDLPTAIQSGLVLSPMFHGLCGVEGLAGPLLADEPPHLGVIATRGGDSWLLQGARISTPDREVLPLVLDRALARTITLLVGAADHLITGRPLPEPISPPPPRLAPSGVRFWTRRLLHDGLPKLRRKLALPLVREDWCVGYRRLQRECSPADLSLAPESFEILESGPDRYFADPFLFRHDGVTALFFEDYDHEIRRGRISHVVFGEHGVRSAVTETLSRPYHLSYPFVFSHAGDVLMIPETNANKTIELYQAERFPHRWNLRSVLIDDIEAADTTLYFDQQAGLWWLFTTVTEFGSSSHDTLSIFFSDRLVGPWRPHPANPVKFDPGSSRPAGPLMRWEGKLFRPAQDCTLSYGSGLVWCEVEELTPARFRERVVARQGPARGFTGLHTYGRAAGFEVVDFLRNRWRLGA